MVNKNVLSCLLKDGKEVNAVMLVGRLFRARATVTQNDRSGVWGIHRSRTRPIHQFDECYNEKVDDLH